LAGQTDIIIAAILGAIEDGSLTPGKLIEESALIEAHGVSRTPVREAFIQLEAAGLIQRLPRKGAVVFRPSLAQFLAILEVHAKLEGQAAGLAARRLSVGHAARIEAATAACEAHAATHGDARPDAYYQLNMAYHAAVADAACNPYLLDMIKTNARKLMAYYRARYHYKGVIGSSAREHRQITALILARDADGAERAMAAHVQFDQLTAMDLLAVLD